MAFEGALQNAVDRYTQVFGHAPELEALSDPLPPFALLPLTLDEAIDVALGDSDGSETLSITIAGVPTGASLSAGTDNGGGSWTLSAGQLDGLTITPPADSGDDFTLQVTATTTETDPDTGATSTATTGPMAVPVSVAAVADAPELGTTTPATGAEDTAIALEVNASLGDSDGSEILGVTITGVPTGASLSAGTDNGGGSWTLSAGQLDGLTITPPADSGADFTLQVSATATETDPDTGIVTTATSGPVPIAVAVTAVADTPSLDVSAASGDEDTAIALNIGAVLDDTDGSEVLGVTVAGVPTGASLSAGTDNGDGSWTLGAGDLASLTLTPPSGDSSDFTLQVTSTALETDPDTGVQTTATNGPASLAVTVNETSEEGVTLVGTPEVDTLTGGGGDDNISGLGDDDTLIGNAGDDTLDGGAGSDTLYGGAGNDTLLGDSGGSGSGGSGSGGSGRGGSGSGGGSGDETSFDDYLDGGVGNDVLTGGQGADTLLGGSGTDTLTGGEGGDTLDGGAGADTLDGGKGADMLYGDSGDDVIVGGGGDDTITGGVGADTLTGGKGEDTFEYNSLAEGGDFVTDFDSGKDSFVFDADEFGDAFDESGNVVFADFDESATPQETAFVYDAGGDGDAGRLMYYDSEGSDPGYTVVAEVTGDGVAAADITANAG